VCDGNANIPHEPWNHYIATGNSLGAYRPKSSDKADAKETQKFPFQNANQVEFDLGVPVKRTVGGVLNTLASAGNEIAYEVNHSSGQVFLGAPLSSSQQLVVGYWPVQSGYSDNLGPTVIDTSDGDFITSTPPPALAPPVVKAANQLFYKKGETLAHFLQTNVLHGIAFLTGADADKRVEFTVDQNNRPVQPRDPRYQFMTSQPYASSSYGFFQLTLLPFTPGPRIQLNQAFNPGYSTASSCPIQNCVFPMKTLYQLLAQPQTNFDLAGNYHKLSLKTLVSQGKLTDCRPNNCNTAVWQLEWTEIIREFNRPGNGYGGFVSQIVSDGDLIYAARNPSPQ